MKAAVYGSGALGTAIGALITKAGGKVDLVEINPTQVEALRKEGARVVGDRGEFNVPVNVLYPQETTPGYDVILLATNEKGNADALARIKEVLAENGIVVSLQNGMTDDQIIKEVGALRTMGCAVDWTSEQLEPGKVKINAAGDQLRAYIGKVPGVMSNQAMNARNLLSKAGDVHYINDLLGARWGKLVINCSLSAVSTIYGKTFGETVHNWTCRGLMLEAANECMEVAEAKGIKIPNFEDVNFEKVCHYHSAFGKFFRMLKLPKVIKYHKDAISAMLQDLNNKIPLELDYVSGLIIRDGKERGVETPVVALLQKALLKIEAGKLDHGIETIKAIKKNLR